LLTFISPVNASPVLSVASGISVTLNKLQLAGGGGATCATTAGLLNNAKMYIEKVRVRDGYCPNGTGGIINNGEITGVFLDIWDNIGGASGGAGGLFNAGTFNMSGVAILRNEMREASLAGNGGGITNRGVITLNAASIISNVATSGAGVFQTAGTSTFVNASIAQNLAHRVGTQTPHRGAGVFTSGGVMRLWYATVTENRYRNDYSTSVLEDGPGVSLFAEQNALIEVNSSIVHRVPVNPGINPGNCSGAIVRTGASIASDDTCGLPVVDPQFDPVRPFGFYSTRELIYVRQYSRPLLPTSPALNAGDMAICNLPLLGGEDIFNSGRGSDSTCDLGSMEMPWGYATGPTPTPYATVTPTPTPLPANSCDNLIPRNTISVASFSSEEAGSLNYANFVNDGNPATYWHTAWINNALPFPHEIVLDTRSTRVLSCIKYLPRQDAPFNRIRDYEIYVSDSTSNWGQPVRAGVFPETEAEQSIPFPPKQGRYLRLRALSSFDGAASAAAAEIRVGLSVPISATATPTPASPPTSTPVVQPSATPQPAANACGPVIARDGWKVQSTTSEEPGSWNFARLAFDGATNSYWHTRWITGTEPYPHELVIDLGAERLLACFSYFPRSDNAVARIKDFEFYVSKDGAIWGPGVVYWSFTSGPGEARFRFAPVTARYIRLRATNSHNNDSLAAVAELNVFAPPGAVTGPLPYVAGADSPSQKAPDQYRLYLATFAGKRTYLPITAK
jgi:hypothetical protein